MSRRVGIDVQKAAEEITAIQDPVTQCNLAASAAILAGLVLDKSLIQQIPRRELVQESVIYREIRAEGLAEGREEGLQQGLQQGFQQEGKLLVVHLLNRRVEAMSADLVARVEGLLLKQLEALAEALLDFQGKEDLMQCLSRHC